MYAEFHCTFCSAQIDTMEPQGYNQDTFYKGVAK